MVRADHADYVGSWLKVLKQDQRAIFSAAAHAQRAVDFVQALRDRQVGNSPDASVATSKSTIPREQQIPQPTSPVDPGLDSVGSPELLSLTAPSLATSSSGLGRYSSPSPQPRSTQSSAIAV